MKTEPIYWEVQGFSRPFPCFIRGCDEDAVHLTKITQGDAVIQVCLCDQCVSGSWESILLGLRSGKPPASA